MTNLIPMNTVGPVHSTLVSAVTPVYYSDYTSEHDTGVDSIIDTIDTMSETVQDTYRGDMITDVNAGLGVVVTGIKIISAILTVIGGSQNRR